MVYSPPSIARTDGMTGPHPETPRPLAPATDQQRALQAAIERRAADVGHQDVPAVILPTPRDEWYDLDRGEWVPDSEEDEIARLEARLRELKKSPRHIFRLGTITSAVPVNLRRHLGS